MHLKRATRSGLISSAVVALFCTVPSIAQQNVKNQQSPIVVELSVKKTTVYPGEMLRLHVAIKNRGDLPLYIPTDISEVNQRFVLTLRYGSKLEGSGTMVVADGGLFAPSQVPPFANLLSMQWIVLDPGMFYGCDIDLYANDLPRLRIPGKYILTGRYASHGFRENLRGFEEDTGKLPFRAWEGEVETNPVKIVVTTAAK
jgi:hypothetical protein